MEVSCCIWQVNDDVLGVDCLTVGDFALFGGVNCVNFSLAF